MPKNEAPELENKFRSEKSPGEARSKKEVLLGGELYRFLFLFIRRFKNKRFSLVPHLLSVWTLI